MATPSPGPQVPPADEQVVTTWLRQHAIPVQHLEAGNGFADLRPLKEMLKGVRVVGLGEATHGTREFFQLKHRLLEFLVTEMGFTAFALEASYAACQPINEFVLHGKGDRAMVLTGLGYIAWDTEEFSVMLDWLRAYNQRVPDEKKVRFYGLDCWRNEIGRRGVLEYLQKVAPDRLQAVGEIFADLAGQEEKWPWRTEKEVLGRLLPQIQDVIDQLMANKAEYSSRSSATASGDARQYLRVMRQWLIEYNTSIFMRSVFMAENLDHIRKQEGPDTKFVLWAHNCHIQVEPLFLEGRPSMGYCLRENLGLAYFAVGFEFEQGSFQSRTTRPDKLLGDLKEVSLGPTPVGSLAWYLSRTKVGPLILKLRSSVGDPAVEAWLRTPRTVQSGAWSYEQGWSYSELSILDRYDAVVFVEKTTATLPTANALKSVANGEGF